MDKSPTSFPNRSLTIRRDQLDLGIIATTLAASIVLMGPWADLRSIVAPLFLFLLPGCALVVLVRGGSKGPAELIASSFLVSMALNLLLRLGLELMSLTISSHLLINGLAIWTLGLLLVAYLRDLFRHSRPPITLERSELGLVLLLVLLYAGMSLFVLVATYTPAPDEMTYMLHARQFNLEGAIPVVDSTKAWAVNLVLSRPLWWISLASYYLVSQAAPFSSQALGVFFLTMLVLATYRVGKRVLGGGVGLIAAVLLAVSPSILIWGSTVLLDLPFAAFLILGYGYFLESIRLKGGKLEGIAVGSLVLALVSILFSSLVKLADPVLPALIYLYFLYLIWKSNLPWKRLALAVLVAIPSIYLTFDGLYNIFTYIVPNQAIHDLIRPFLPLSFFERFFALFYQGTVYKPITAIRGPWGVVQGMYLAGFQPFLFTYPVLFMSIAGMIMMIRVPNGELSKGHGVFSVLVIGLASLLAALFLYSYETARNVLYIYPFIIIAAAAGFRFSPKKHLKEFVLSTTGIVVLIYVVESSMLTIGISMGAIPAPDQHSLSLLSLNFLLGAAILVWKVLETTVGRPTSQTTKRWKEGGGLSSPPAGYWVVAVALVCLFSISQFSVFAHTSPYRSTSEFAGLGTWVDSHVRTGDVVFTNGQDTLMSLVNDHTLQLFNSGSVQLVSVTNSSTVFLQLIKSSAGAYLIVFKQSWYTDIDSYSPQQFFAEEQFSRTFVNTADYQIYDLSAQASSTLSILKISTTNSQGEQITGYHTTLWQGGVKLDSCYSPCYYDLRNGETYQIAADSYGSENFSHWQSDGSTGFETVNAPNNSSQISLTAIYNP